MFPSDNAPGLYVFDVREKGPGQSKLIKELRESPHVLALITRYSVKPGESYLRERPLTLFAVMLFHKLVQPSRKMAIFALHTVKQQINNISSIFQ